MVHFLYKYIRMRHAARVLLITLISIGCESSVPVSEVERRYREFRVEQDYYRVDNVDVLFVVDSAMATETG